ncbi:MAG TPA: hypothetical protein VL574_00090 [Stellaceae bacterium]|nr:hypothetical protein [Stellaceae bacterium]
MQVTLAADAASGISNVREDIQRTKKLLEGREGSLNNYYAALMYSVAEHHGPRHRHDFDQIRYAIEGDFVYADGKVLPKGWVGYFPEGTYYGPQIRRPGLDMLFIEFGGASGMGYLSKRQRRAAVEVLNAKGRFAKGMFSYTDENGIVHTEHAHEAMSEVARGVRLPIPEPRYSEVVTMNPASFAWIEDDETPGIAHKWLGTFNERGARVGFIRLDAGITFSAGRHRAPEVLFLTKGAVTCQGRDCPMQSAFSVEAGEGPVPITATEPSELLCLQLPVF